MAKSGKKTNLKLMMRQCGVTMQRVADYSGVSKTDVCRIMNEEMEEQVLKTVTKLLKSATKNQQKFLYEEV